MPKAYTYLEEDEESLKRTVFGKTIPHFGYTAYLGKKTVTDDFPVLWGESKGWHIPPGGLLYVSPPIEVENYNAVYGEPVSIIIPPGTVIHRSPIDAEDYNALYGESNITVETV